MKLDRYLKQGRPGSQHWQLRQMVPKDLRAALGKREFTKAIRAATRQDAVAIAWPILEEWGALIKAARHPASKDEPAPSSPDTGQAGFLRPQVLRRQRELELCLSTPFDSQLM